MHRPMERRFPVGAEPLNGGVSFRVWAPDHDKVELVADGRRISMHREAEGYWTAFVPGMAAGTRYQFALNADLTLPDPVSRFQPLGANGPSMVVDPVTFQWTDTRWTGPLREAVYYELHIGTFTPEGTFAAAAKKLQWLKDLGVTVIEIMPLNTCAGSFGWGYDGILLFAPMASYGDPDDVRRFVDQAHALGLGVIHDVVYNHFGPGEICPHFAQDYYSQRPANEWGKSINFDGPNSGPVREFFCCNAAYWISEYHFDGLRIDATQALLDESDDHIISALGHAARAAAGDRRILLVSENERQESFQVRAPDRCGHGLDALWNDDFHHSARVALTGRREGYFHDHAGRAQEFVSAAKHGYLFQGQRYNWQNAQRGYPALDLQPSNFVHFIQNHDQIANTPASKRIGQLTSPAKLRAMTALLLLGPQSPLLFQGQEFNASTTFTYFTDQPSEMTSRIWEGRRGSLAQFPSMEQPEARAAVPPPHERRTLEQSKLDWVEAEQNSDMVKLHIDLLQLRRDTKVLQHAQRVQSLDGATLSEEAFLLRFFHAEAAEERLLMINLGRDLPLRSIPDPLYAPPPEHVWKLCWSSEDYVYDGSGQRQIDVNEPWILTADTALFFRPISAERRDAGSKPELDVWQKSLGESGA